MQITLWLILCVASAILYRMGGNAEFNTKFRDFGCPLATLLVVILLGGFHWSAIISTALMFGAMTTYWKNVPDAKWYHWFLTGLMYAVSWLPYCLLTDNQKGFALYAIIVSIGTTLWSEFQDEVNLEEGGRGLLVVLLAPCLVNPDFYVKLIRGFVIQ